MSHQSGKRTPVRGRHAGDFAMWIWLTGACLIHGFMPATAQVTASVGGYLSEMPSVFILNHNHPWTWDNQVHNRLNFKAGLGCTANVTLEVRNRLLSGKTIRQTTGYKELLGQDRGWLDLTWNLASDTAWVINTSIDRAQIDLNMGRLQATIGRQRINWGLNFVWNPNDIFNTYSFFDFDYIERPGSDAIRLQYYFTPSAHLELVGKWNRLKQLSSAGLLRFSMAGYDFQLLGGVLEEREVVAGGGFSGYLGPVAINGELTYLHPRKNIPGPGPVTIASVGINYTAPFKLNTQAEYLYNEAAGENRPGSFGEFYYRSLSVRDLSFAPHTFFLSLNYPVTPLINAGISTMLFPKQHGFFAGPTLDVSLLKNLDLSLIVQYFRAEWENGANQQGAPSSTPATTATLGFLRLKWSF